MLTLGSGRTDSRAGGDLDGDGDFEVVAANGQGAPDLVHVNE